MSSDRSARKSARNAERKRLRNHSRRSSVKTFVRKAEGLIESGQLAEADVAVLQAISALDTAAQKGTLPRNNAARRKSRLMRKYTQGKLAAAAN